MTKKEQTIQKIMEIATLQFGNHGYDKTSTNKIATEANVSKGIIFKYFSTKEALYQACLIRVMNIMLRDFESLTYQEEDPIARIGEMATWKAKYLEENHALMAMVLEAMNKFPDVVQNFIRQEPTLLKGLWIEPLFVAIDESKLDPCFNKSDLIRYVMYAIEGMQSSFLKEGNYSRPYDELKQEFITMIKIIIKGMEKDV